MDHLSGIVVCWTLKFGIAVSAVFSLKHNEACALHGWLELRKTSIQAAAGEGHLEATGIFGKL